MRSYAAHLALAEDLSDTLDLLSQRVRYVLDHRRLLLHLSMRYLGRHGSLHLADDDAAIRSAGEELIGVVERRLPLLVGEDGVGAGLDQVFNDQVVPVSSCDVQGRVHHIVSLFVDVLPLPDNNADEVKFTIMASFPNV